MAPFGYTPQRAEEAKDTLDLRLGQAENRIRWIAGVVPGAGEKTAALDDALELIRGVVSDLQQLVDDRTDVAGEGGRAAA